MKTLRLNKLYILIILCSGILVSSCVTVQQPVAPAPSYKYDFSSLYNPGESDLHPQFRVYKNNDTSVLVFYKIPVSELKRNYMDPSTSIAKLQFKYVLRNTDNFEIVDSSAFTNSINLKDAGIELESYFHVRVPDKGEYKVIVSIYGQKINSGKRVILEINNSSIFTQDFFLPESLTGESWDIMYQNYVNEDGVYRLSSKEHTAASVSFAYYKFDEYTCVPPYYLADYSKETTVPDSTFSYKIGDTLRFKAEGIYIMQASAQTQFTMRFINAGKTFPQVSVLEDMLEPLKLLTGNKEYNEIAAATDLKLAIDNYWLTKSNNQGFAREQIRVFYTRVELANQFFSDDKEGWKTDRGIIYVILGPPSIINMSAAGEEWFYGENPDVAGILFVFDRLKNSQFGDTFALRRNEIYQSVWGQALSTWKNGRIFTITNN